MEKQKNLVFLAQEVAISEEDRLDPVFLKVHFKLADNAGNANHEGITEAFINDLISRQEEFECLPMYVDMKSLLAGDYDNLTHMYNRVTKKFSTQQFGSFTNFYSETDEDGVISLYAEARFPKRELDACLRLVELYELGKLCLSIELRYNPEHTIRKNGVKFIDAFEDNALTGAAIVSVPAYSSAVALDMVAEAADDPDIVANGEEQGMRGETEIMDKENELMVADTAEVEVVTEEEKEIVVAEGEGASESGGEGASESGGEGASESGGEGASESGGEGASESGGEGASESGGEGASESGGGAGASDGEGAGEGGGGEAAAVSDSVLDPDDEQRTVAETEKTQAEVLSHSVDVHESVENWGGEPIHVVEVTERIVETLEDAQNVIAEQKNQIAELETQIAQLKEIETKYNAILAAEAEKVLAEKRANAKAFAEKQGLDSADVAVAEAIEKLDYAKIAELIMAEQQEDIDEEPVKETIALASFVDMEVSDDKYGGLLSPRKK